MKKLLMLLLIAPQTFLYAANYNAREIYRVTVTYVEFTHEGEVHIRDYLKKRLDDNLPMVKALLKPFQSVISEQGAIEFSDSIKPKIYRLIYSDDPEVNIDRACALYAKAKYRVKMETNFRKILHPLESVILPEEAFFADKTIEISSDSSEDETSQEDSSVPNIEAYDPTMAALGSFFGFGVSKKETR